MKGKKDRKCICIEHAAMYVNDLEAAKEFLNFDDGARRRSIV